MAVTKMKTYIKGYKYTSIKPKDNEDVIISLLYDKFDTQRGKLAEDIKNISLQQSNRQFNEVKVINK